MGQTSSTISAQSAPSATSSALPAGCPMHQSATAPPAPAAPAAPAQCPVDHGAPPKPAACPVQNDAPPGINPLNQMPTLSQSPSSNRSWLPTDRTVSSIPRDGEGHWEYPSPQQFYNALERKGWETPEEHVEMMVQIHNFLNEQAWEEVIKWEKRQNSDLKDLQLARFKGRPGEISPKARFWLFAGWLLPSRFNTEAPFDRHDWIVRRPATGEEVRYVIDYYSAPPEADGSAVFSLDVRPALDSVSSIKERIAVATEEAWASFTDRKPDLKRENAA